MQCCLIYVIVWQGKWRYSHSFTPTTSHVLLVLQLVNLSCQKSVVRGTRHFGIYWSKLFTKVDVTECNKLVAICEWTWNTKPQLKHTNLSAMGECQILRPTTSDSSLCSSSGVAYSEILHIPNSLKSAFPPFILAFFIFVYFLDYYLPPLCR